MLASLRCLVTTLLLVGGGAVLTAATVASTPPGEAVSSNMSVLTPPVRGRLPPYFRFSINKNEVFFDTKVIPDEHQVAAFLYKGETKLFFYLNERDRDLLVLTVTPCSSSLEWSVRYRPQNRPGQVEESNGEGEVKLASFHANGERQTFRMDQASRGLYVVSVSPLESETYVHFYASHSPPLSQTVPTLSQNAKLRVTPLRRRRSLIIRWEPSMVDPHLMQYCLVVNSRQDYLTLCAARGDRYGVTPPEYPNRTGFDFPRDRQESQKSELASKALRRQASGTGRHDDMLVECVGKKNRYLLSDLYFGKLYHINVFAVNKKSNLSFPYTSTVLKYDYKSPPAVGLKDGKAVRVNFRKQEGLASFKFKVGAGVRETQFTVLPCGGAVYAEVLQGKKTVLERKYIESVGHLRVKNPQAGRFVLRITAFNPDELRRVSALKVIATSRGASSLPQLPKNTALFVFRSLLTCNSVTVGWMPSPDPQATNYCLSCKDENTRHRNHRDRKQLLKTFYKVPNQCEVAKDMTGPTRCFDVPYNASTRVQTRPLYNLRPDRIYRCQLIVRRPRGEPLSYNLLWFATKRKCAN